ncbi:MAG TPA: hypothetical protein VJK02_11995 [Anaerolineales bacterium]|nr:hypothetical protein [Anaerolineales bacterium]
MKPRRLPRLVPQPSLFDPPPATPRWEALPAEIRQAVLPLLARLLREHPLPADVHEVQEVADE